MIKINNIINDYEDEEEEIRDNRIGGNFNVIYEAWKDVFEQYTWNNPIYLQLLLHVLLGQQLKFLYIKKNEIVYDGRISFLLIQNSGTGKTQSFIPFMKIAKGIIRYQTINKERKLYHLKPQEIQDFTDAGLIGSVSADIIEKKIKINHISGILDKENSDFILIKEASSLFNPRDKNSQVKQYFLSTTEPIWSGRNIIKKRMKNGEVKCEVHSSIIMTSTPTNKIEEEDLKMGIFRRYLVYYNFISPKEQHINTQLGIINYQQNKKDIKENEKKYIINIEDLTNLINNAYLLMLKNNEEEKIYVELNEDAINRLKEYDNILFNRCNKMNENVADIFYSICGSYCNYIVVIAGQRAIMSGDKIINKFDIEYAIKLIDALLLNLPEFIKDIVQKKENFYTKLENENEENFNKIITDIFEKTNNILKTDLIKFMEAISLFSQNKNTEKDNDILGVFHSFGLDLTIYKNVEMQFKRSKIYSNLKKLLKNEKLVEREIKNKKYILKI